MSTGNLPLPRSWRDSFKNDSVRGVSMQVPAAFIAVLYWLSMNGRSGDT